MKREQKKNIENLKKEIEEKKKIPIDVKKKINFNAIKNLAILSIIIVYLIVLYFGMNRIQTDIYLMSLRILSGILLLTAIIIFEFGYKKDNEEIWLHGLEILIVSFFSLYGIYFYSIFYSNYGKVVLTAGISFLIYFAIKIIIIQKRLEKKYKKSLTDIGEIVKK